VGLALVFKIGKRNVDVFLEQQHLTSKPWSESLLGNASSQLAAFSRRSAGAVAGAVNCSQLTSQLTAPAPIPAQISAKPTMLPLPGAATAARLRSRRGA